MAGVNGENLDTPAQSLRELAQQKVDEEYAAAHEGQVLEDEIPSAEGKILRGNTTVEIADIDSKDGKSLKVKLTDGSTADVAELSFPDAGEQELWRVIGEYAESAEAARLLLKEFRAGNLDAYKFARGAEEGFLYGMANISPGEMETRGSYVNLLDPMQRNMAYRQGQIAGERKARQRQEKIQAGKQKSSNKKGQLYFEGDRNSLTKRQKVSLQACEVIAKALGIQVYVFESERVNGKRVGDNGWYDPKDGSIHIDLHAGENAEGVMVFTLAHELGHFIKDWSPVKFRTLSKFLAEQYAKKGESVDLLVRRQQQKAEADGRKLSYEEAHEEWVCDSLETMLTDGTIMEKLSMLQAKDAGLVEKIKSFLDQFVKKLKAAYEGIRPQTVEGQIVSEMVDAAQELQELFADALIDAGENFKTAEKNTTGEGGVRFCSRGEAPIDFNPKGLSLEEQLKEILDTAQSFDGRYLYIGKFTANFINLMKEYVDIKEYPIVMNYRDAYLSMESKENGRYQGAGINYHNIGIEGMVDAINAFDDPEAVMLSKKEGKIELAIKGADRKGRPLLAIVEINTSAQNARKFIRAHVTTSIYGKRNIDKYIETAKNADRLIYKKQEESAQGITQVQYEGDINANSSKTSIRNSEENVKEKDSTEKRTSSRSGNVSDRAMLVDLFEQMVTDSNEYKALQNYKKNMDRMLSLEEKIERLGEEIRRISFAEGPRDVEYLNNLKWQRKQAVAELDKYDNILLGLEKSGVLRAMIERNRKVITQKSYDEARTYYRQKNETREAEIRQYYRESRRQAVERHDKAQVRQQIRKDVQRLDSLLNKGTKEKNVKLELQEFAGAALRTAKGAFLKNYNEYDMVRNGVNATMSREQKTVFNRCRELLNELDQIREQRDMEPGPNSIHEKWDPEAELRRDDREEALKKELAKNMAILRDAGIFRVENELLEDSIADQLMDECCPLRLDAAEHLFSPKAKMQTSPFRRTN